MTGSNIRINGESKAVGGICNLTQKHILKFVLHLIRVLASSIRHNDIYFTVSVALQLNCWMFGNDGCELLLAVFPIKIANAESVGTFEKAIKAENRRRKCILFSLNTTEHHWGK
jgi:hypothetical protein